MAKRKCLLIGGTGTISSAVTRRLAADPDWELFLFNRGQHAMDLPEGVQVIRGDISKEEEAAKILEGKFFDCVAEFTGFRPEQVERDVRLFKGKTDQFIYISSAAAYHTPPSRPFMTEGMLLPYRKVIEKVRKKQG